MGRRVDISTGDSGILAQSDTEMFPRPQVIGHCTSVLEHLTNHDREETLEKKTAELTQSF